MCLAVIGLSAHPEYLVAIAGNRDERHERPTAPATWWDAGWLAGRDLAEGGTWLGVHRSGRWALLTNIREPALRRDDAPTRGTLVTRVLAAAREPEASLGGLTGEMARYNGFNLLAGAVERAYWLSNRAGGPHPLRTGVHAISNGALDEPWPKVRDLRAAFEAWCARGDGSAEPLFAALASRAQPPESALPSTGIAPERERLLAPAFIVSPDYGTRSSTVILVRRSGDALFVERSFDPAGRCTGEVSYRFPLDAGAVPSASERRIA